MNMLEKYVKMNLFVWNDELLKMWLLDISDVVFYCLSYVH